MTRYTPRVSASAEGLMLHEPRIGKGFAAMAGLRTASRLARFGGVAALGSSKGAPLTIAFRDATIALVLTPHQLTQKTTPALHSAVRRVCGPQAARRGAGGEKSAHVAARNERTSCAKAGTWARMERWPRDFKRRVSVGAAASVIARDSAP
jgi:hypothetical protein